MEAPAYHSGSLAFTSTFREPVFGLSRDGHLLQQSLFRALREFGLGLEDMDETGALQGAGKWSLSAPFLSHDANLRVDVGAFDVTFLGSTPSARVHEVVRAIEGAVVDTLPGIELARRGGVYQGHMALPGKDYHGKAGPFWGTYPEGLGELAAQGMGYYFRSALFSGESSIVVDKSVVVPGGLFLQVRCGFDVEDFELEDVLANFHGYLVSVGRAFGLSDALGAYGADDESAGT